MKPPKLLLAVPSVLLLAALVPAEIVEQIVAKVNGDIITLSEFENRQVAAVQAARIRREDIPRFLRENNARILQEMIDDLLLVQRAAELNLRLRSEYVQEFIEQIKKENSIDSDEALREQLRREGMSLDDLKRNIERSILKRQVLGRELEGRVAASEADARAEYDAHLQQYTKPATVKLQEIFVRSEEGSDAAALARELVARLRAGEDFAALAREHSAAPTRDSGGALGTLAQGELHPDIERVAFALKPGEVGGPIRTEDGYRILRLEERTEGSIVPFEEAKAEILRRLSQQRLAEAYEKYIEELRKTAVVDIRVREVPLQLSVPVTGSPLLEPPAATLPSVRPAPEAGPAVPAPAPESEDEFQTTPQARPERVVPAPLPGEVAPSPSPSPSPS